jgi:glycosyltransferase involved in cell wall biosynthesis
MSTQKNNEISSEEHDMITVGIITKNEGKTIGNLLRSLQLQSYPKSAFEIIICDGNSTDNTLEVIDSILKWGDIQYAYISEWTLPPDANGCTYGHSFARNVVIDHACKESKYIAWIDADCRADENWLYSLWKTITPYEHDPKIAWAWGTRLVETFGTIGKKELLLNYYITNPITSLKNPAFSENTEQKINSIAWYNSIYKKDIVWKYRYSTQFPLYFDDIELNFRLKKAGYSFVLSKESLIYHRMDPSLKIFYWQFYKYGWGAMNVSLIHKTIARMYIVLSLLYTGYTLTLPIWIYLSHRLFSNIYLPFIPYLWVIFLGSIISYQILKKIKHPWGVFACILTCTTPIMYGLWSIKSLFHFSSHAHNYHQSHQ